MKKLFLLIIASWATSCLPALAPPRFSEQQLRKMVKIAKTRPETQKTLAEIQKTLAETQETGEKKAILNNSFCRGALSGIVGVVAYSVVAKVFTEALNGVAPLLGVGTAVACSLIQNSLISEENKSKTTTKERAIAHVQGMVSIGLMECLAQKFQEKTT